jgi:limonene 1,2-monooxygenase
MLGIDHTTQRERMDESLGVILRLLTETEPITYRSDWFQLQEAMLQLRPYQRPHMPIAVAAAQSPSGPALAGKHGAAILSMNVPAANAQADLDYLWTTAEESAAEHGQSMDRHEWRLVMPVHLAESKKEAMEDARLGAGRFQREYFEQTLGRPSEDNVPLEKIIDQNVDAGSWVVGTPDDCIAAIRRLQERSGGFGGFLIQANDWAPREKALHSYELLARYVMPHFQGTLAGLEISNQWSKDHVPELLDMRTRAIDRARQAWTERNN